MGRQKFARDGGYLGREKGEGEEHDEQSNSRCIVSVLVTVCVVDSATSSLDTMAEDELLSIVLVGVTVEDGGVVLAR